MTNGLELNPNASIEDVAQLVNLMQEQLIEGGWDAATETFIGLHNLVFADAPQPDCELPPLPVVEPKPLEENLMLLDDELTCLNRSGPEIAAFMRKVLFQIIDGEREPVDFLEAMELCYRLSLQYVTQSEQAAQRVEQAEARLVHLMQQNQHLLGVLNLISQGSDYCTPQYHN